MFTLPFLIILLAFGASQLVYAQNGPYYPEDKWSLGSFGTCGGHLGCALTYKRPTGTWGGACFCFDDCPRNNGCPGYCDYHVSLRHAPLVAVHCAWDRRTETDVFE